MAAKRKQGGRRKIPILINFTVEAAKYLKEESLRTGRPMNMILEDSLMGRHRPADIQASIIAKSRELNVPHSVVEERALRAYLGLGK